MIRGLVAVIATFLFVMLEYFAWQTIPSLAVILILSLALALFMSRHRYDRPRPTLSERYENFIRFGPYD